jgi:hypothetical protein
VIFPSFADRQPQLHANETRLPEIHLYFGSLCNRSCDFCVVSGSPEGWVAELDERLLDSLLTMVHPQAQIKIYGGEPTLIADNLAWAFGYLRARGFAGRLVIFSNGIQAHRLIRLLKADEDICCVLNYSILTGTDAEPLPTGALQQLIEHERQHPGRLFAGHADLIQVGRAVGWEKGQLTERSRFEQTCPRCHPVLTTRGKYHACPFAVEVDAPQYRLGDLASAPEEVRANFDSFLHWIDAVLLPAAQQQRRHPCQVCTAAAGTLPLPGYAVDGFR